MKLLSLAILLFLCVQGSAQAWQQFAGFPAAGRDDGSVFTIGNTVYCGLGNAQGIGPSSDFYKFGLLAENWLGASAALPALGRQYCCSFSSGTFGFIAAGVDANWKATNEVWRYDTVSNSWAQKTSMPDSVQGAACFFINNKAYICGGRNQANLCTNKVWEYDIANDSWQQKNNMPDGGRWRASATVVNGKGYLLFGADANGKFSKQLYEYDASVDSWSLIDSFPGVARTYSSAATINNFVIVAMGIDSANAVYNDCYLYDVVSHQWITQNMLPSFGRKGCMAFSHNDSFYLTAGIDGSGARLTETWKISGVNSIHENLREMKVYPVPCNDVLHIEGLNADHMVEVCDLLGKVICESKSRSGTLDVREFEPGTYFIRISSKSSAFSERIIVVR